MQVHKYGQLVFQNAAGAANCFFRVDCSIGLDLDNQLIEIGALFNTGGFNVVRNPMNRAERGIQLQAADRAGLLFKGRALRCRAIAAAGL